MSKEVKNLPASIHDRLLHIAKQNGFTFDQVFSYYTLEGLVHRLFQSRYAQSYVLKGALMFFGWGLPLRRPTQDIDLHGYATNTIENLVQIIREVCALPMDPPDGMMYDPDSVTGETVQNDADYQGVRLHVTAYLGRSICKFHVDISFANEITPGVIEAQYLTILKTSSFAIKGYPYETSIAEKLHAMIVLDLANDRLKDFYDIWLIAHQFNVMGQLLVDAMTNTFRARKTNIPQDVPTVFTDRFVQEKKTGWLGFKKKLPVTDPIPADFEKVLVTLREFLIPPLQAAAELKPFKMSWSRTKGWIGDKSPENTNSAHR